MMSGKNEYADVHITVQGQDRIVSGLDIPLILQGQPRPLRDANREIVAVRCVVTDIAYLHGPDMIFMIDMKEVSRMHRAELIRKEAT
jgi:hypothetical protein